MTLTGCLRNAQAVAEFAQAQGKQISIVPAGERFYYTSLDTALRPSLEDWIGAGAIISHLQGSLSPEAQTAKVVYDAHRNNLPNILKTCVSGVELIEKGYDEDIRLASQLNVSQNVSLLIDGAYQQASQEVDLD